MKRFISLTRSFLIFVMVACSLMAQTKRPQYKGDSPREFVEGFYAWYVPRAPNQDTTAGWNTTLRLIHLDISPKLTKLLDEDSSAQANCRELVGLDFDPFLYTQEPAEHYEVRNIAQREAFYRADIYRVVGGKRTDKPDVVAEFIRKNGRWVFTNFHYSGGGDLLSILKSRPRCSESQVVNK